LLESAVEELTAADSQSEAQAQDAQMMGSIDGSEMPI